ncbi:MAG: S9 family peptidase, partial [Bacteroidota bacterium]
MTNKSNILRLIILSSFLISAFLPINAQENLKYQKPPKEILDLVDVPLAPRVLIDDKGEQMVLRYSDSYKTLAELSEKELRLGGLRINPKTNIGSRTTYYKNIKVKNVKDKDAIQVAGLPANARIANFKWSPDQTKLAFTNTVTEGVGLWVLDIKKAQAIKITEPKLNANMRNPISWFKDGNSLLVKFLPGQRKSLINTDVAVPDGPTVTISSGKKAQNRTYQDLLKNSNDEFNFEQLSMSELYKVNLDGSKTKWKEKAMYSSISFSPDGNYVMVTNIDKPFSYIVPYYRFPQRTTIYKSNGDFVKTINEVPLTEVLPKGFMAVRKGKRSMNWRNDKPATLVWVEALDEGDPEKKVDYRDEIFQLEAPFSGKAKSIFKTINRFSYIQWGNENMAIAHDFWWNTRNTKSYVFNPSNAKQQARVIFDRNYQDRYSDPGNFVTKRNEYGRDVLEIDGGNAYLVGDGYTKNGQFPFIDKMNLKSKETKRLYQSKYKDKAEDLSKVVDMKKGKILVRIESPKEYPNYYFR